MPEANEEEMWFITAAMGSTEAVGRLEVQLCLSFVHIGPHLTKGQLRRFRTLFCPVLKINNHATGGWRTKDILRGPKSLETKKLGSSKGWGDQSAKKTNNWRDKKYLMNRWGTKKLRTYVVGWFCWNLRAFWEDQTDQKSAVGGPKRILRTGWPRHKEPIL